MKYKQQVSFEAEEAEFLAKEQIDSTEAFILGFLKGFNREDNQELADAGLLDFEIEIRGYR